MFFNKRNKEEIKPKEEDNFTGWGCYGIIKGGIQHPDFEMFNWSNLEKMIESASENKQLIGLKIFKCYRNYFVEKKFVIGGKE